MPERASRPNYRNSRITVGGRARLCRILRDIAQRKGLFPLHVAHPSVPILAFPVLDSRDLGEQAARKLSNPPPVDGECLPFEAEFPDRGDDGGGPRAEDFAQRFV